jgi:riboflavin synthase
MLLALARAVGGLHAAAPRIVVPLLAGRAAVAKAMFSGIVEEMGRVSKLDKVPRLKQWDGTVGEGWELEVEATVALEGASLGCSIAVNGVCLTVTEFDKHKFKVGLAPETIRRTNLERLVPGDPVNVERALPADGRNSGHFVQGHVDDIGIIKGFIAIDGTSLTVCNVNAAEGWFDFMLIAFTQQKVVIPKKAVGDAVNLEVDVLAKYVEQGLKAVTARLDALEAKLAKQ